MNLTLDEKDRDILRALEKNARATIADIAKETKLQRDVVQYRIKRMRSNGIIEHISPICNTDTMGYPVYSWVCVQLQQFDEEIEKQFRAFLREHKNTIYVSKVTGHYHYMFTVATKTIQEFDEFLREVLGRFPGLIKNYNTSLMIEEVQYDSFYKLIE